MTNAEKNAIFYGLANVYIFKELYRYSFIKSKSFNLANGASDLQNKIMHIVKSTANAVVQEGNTQYVNSTTFSGNQLNLNLTYIRQNGNETVLEHKLKEVFSLALNNNTCFGWSVYRGKATFSINGIGGLRNLRQYDDDEMTITQLNNIVNGIMYIPRAVEIVCEQVQYMQAFTNDYVYSYEDIMRILDHVNVHVTRNPNLGRALAVLKWIYRSPNSNVLTEKMDLNDQNDSFRNIIGRYSYYSSFDTEPCIVTMCDKIDRLGEANGYDPGAAAQGQTEIEW